MRARRSVEGTRGGGESLHHAFGSQGPQWRRRRCGVRGAACDATKCGVALSCHGRQARRAAAAHSAAADAAGGNQAAGAERRPPRPAQLQLHRVHQRSLPHRAVPFRYQRCHLEAEAGAFTSCRGAADTLARRKLQIRRERSGIKCAHRAAPPTAASATWSTRKHLSRTSLPRSTTSRRRPSIRSAWWRRCVDVSDAARTRAHIRPIAMQWNQDT